MEDSITRKRRQNRLRQKAWRERKKAANYKTERTVGIMPWKGCGMLIFGDQHESGTSNTQLLSHSMSLSPEMKTTKKHKVIPPLLPYTAYRDEQPPRIRFPLSADHCLIALVQYNIVRAMIFNLAIVSLQNHVPQGCPLAFNVPNLGVVPVEVISPDLQHTYLQQSTPHSYWISVIPIPRLRDNLILFAGRFDEREFCYDLGLGLYEGFDDTERRGLLVWGQSWRGHGWEVSQGFVRKWGFLLKGCSDLISSTNHWREQRGEDELVADFCSE